MAPLLRMEKVSKRFGGVQALADVTFELESGEIHALVGENGAGKSTLMKVLGGAIQADHGRIIKRGQEVQIGSPTDAIRHRIKVIYQEFNLVPSLSVAENIFLGRVPKSDLGVVLDRQRLRRDAVGILDRLGVNIDPDTRVSRLSVAEQQLVEVAKAISSPVEILVMDEPTAALTPQEIERLYSIVRGLKGEEVGIVFISHRLEEIFEITDRVTVLKDGHVVGTRSTSELTTDQLIHMMVNRDLKELFPKTVVSIGDPILEVRGLSWQDRVKNVSFQLRCGEILGIAGLVGAGRTELCKAIFGAVPGVKGTIVLDGVERKFHSPRQAIQAGLVLVPEDRKNQGLVMELSVSRNLVLSVGREIRRALRFLDFRKIAEITHRFVRDLRIATFDPFVQCVKNLSGGNQQKVVLGRGLAAKARVLILDEPTRGVDVGAKEEIHRIMGQFVAQGNAIIMVSSELPEVLAVSDRVLVMHAGEVQGCLPREEASEESVMRLALGVR